MEGHGEFSLKKEGGLVGSVGYPFVEGIERSLPDGRGSEISTAAFR